MEENFIFRKKEFVVERLTMWYDAEAAVATGQSYKIGKRELTRAHISEIRKQIDYWEAKLNDLESGLTQNGRVRRVVRMVPRDL